MAPLGLFSKIFEISEAQIGVTERMEHGSFSTRDTRVLTGHSFAHYVCSLAPLTLLTRSAALRSLTHFAHSLMGQLKFLNMCSRCYRVSREQMRFGRCRASERSERCERTNMASDRVAFSKRDCL